MAIAKEKMVARGNEMKYNLILEKNDKKSEFRLPATSVFFPEAKIDLRKQDVWHQLLR